MDWVHGNAGKRRAAVVKYEEKPESREKKAKRQRRKRLTKYGLTEDAFQEMLVRQKQRCAGCLTVIDEATARIDHDHLSGKVRGLLCDQCNWTLGLVRDDPARLYQLAAHLELDRSQPVAYLIGSLRNPKIVEIGNAIRSLGIECVDNWFAAGEIADDAWKDYSIARGRTYQEALESREARHIYHFDKAYLNLCDVVILVYPAGKSSHLEFGYAIGRGKRGFILIEEGHLPDRYDVMMQFGESPLKFSLPELLESLSRLKERPAG